MSLNTADRVLAVLTLFSMEHSEWTVETAAKELGIPVSTAYRYFASLHKAGLIVNFSAGRYVLGPAIIELDRQTRQFDPLIRSASDTMKRLISDLPFSALALVCRIYRLTVMCVDQARTTDQHFAISYERGRPMPLLKGAASLAITAHLPTRTLKRYFETQTEIDASWEDFRRRMLKIRNAGVCMTAGELDRGLTGVSAPIFAADGNILASIGIVIETKKFSEARREAVLENVRLSAEKVTEQLRPNK
jgi:DNA-binding IclR family transcriptional regulator